MPKLAMAGDDKFGDYVLTSLCIAKTLPSVGGSVKFTSSNSRLDAKISKTSGDLRYSIGGGATLAVKRRSIILHKRVFGPGAIPVA